jgi:hypothetical protein
MRTIKLHVEEKIYQNVILLLKNLNLDGLQIEDISENVDNKESNFKEGSFNKFVGVLDKDFVSDDVKYDKIVK